MRRYILILLLLVGGVTCSAQVAKIDSLKLEISRVKDISKAKLYIDLALEYFHINIDSSALYFEKVREYAPLNKDKESLSIAMTYIAYISHLKAKDIDVEAMLSEARNLAEDFKSDDAFLHSYNVSGAYYMSISKLHEALHFFKKNYEYSKFVNNRRYELRSLNNIGAIYLRQNRYAEALEYFIKAYQYSGSKSDKRGEAVLVNNLANIYYYLDDDDNSIKYYKKGLKISEKHSFYDIAFMNCHNLGNIYKTQEKYDDAIDTFEKCITYAEKLSDKSKYAYIYGQLGHIYYKKKDCGLSLEYLEKAIELSKEYNDVRQELVNYGFLVDLLLYEKNYKEARKVLNKTVKLAKQNGSLDIENSAYWDYARMNYDLGRYKEAYDYNDKYHQTEDSIRNREKIARLEELKARFETEKTELENSLLKAKAELTKVSLEKKRNITSALVILVILLLILILVAFLSRHRRGRMNVELLRLNKELEAYNRMKDRFFSIISHDLRTPFNSLIGFSNLINEQAKDNDELSEYSEVLVRTSENTLELLDSVLSWAKSQTGSLDVNFQNTDVSELISSVMKTYESTTNEKGIVFENLCDKSYSIYADIDISRTILRNLFSNAIKFTDKGGRIEVGCEIFEDKLEIFVKDNGIGMSEEDQSKLFVIDEKVSREGTMGEQGTGFGLILIKELAIQNGGDLRFESELGKGSVFSVTFNSSVS